MATISIYSNKTRWGGDFVHERVPGSVSSGIKQAFSSTIKATGTLKDSLASLKKQIDGVSSLVDMSDSSAKLQASVEREETKEGALSLAYDKIEEYMAKVKLVDAGAKKEIRRLKENFYKRYSYLKPDCEKTKKELWSERFHEKLEAFGEWLSDVGEAIKNVVVGVVEWVKKNWKELVIGLAVIVVGAIITVLLSPAAGAVFWQAVGATIFKGLIVAGISAAVSGTISFGVTLYQAKKAGLGTKEAFGYAAQAFGDGLAHGFMTGAFSFAVGSLVNIGAQAFMGKSMLQSSSLLGSIGKGAMYGAVTEGTTSTVVTALEYFVENGTLEGGFEVIFQSMISGIISGTITGGIMGGKQFKMDDSVDDIIRDGSHLEDGKLKPNVKYQTGEHEYIYQTNERGLISKASTDNLQFKTHEGRLNHNSNTYGKGANDHAGHLFGDRYGGSPDIDNLVSQADHVNTSEYKKIENIWAKAKEEGKRVTVDIDINYAKTSDRPVSFDISYTIDDIAFFQHIDN